MNDQSIGVTESATGTDITALGRAARSAGRELALVSTERKNAAILAIADELESNAATVLEQNAEDVEGGRDRGLDDALLDRLRLTDARVEGLVADIRRVAELPDPVGEEIESRVLPNGIRLSRRRVPIGVLGVIYEARPNVTVDVATLCLKTGNAVILRGGSETRRTNLALVEVIGAALERTRLPRSAVQYIGDPDRGLVERLLRLDRYVDMIIPRGGAALHRLCRERSTIPVITGGIGVCHVFVDETADLERAVDIVENAKVQRPSVCNALDTLLVHSKIAEGLLPRIAERLSRSGVELRATEEALAILRRDSRGATVLPAESSDFDTEWLSLILGVRVVAGIDEAISHVQEHGTQHTESILTSDADNADRFVREVDSSAVFVNASTRFNDGGQFGLGAEVAVSTQKLHARGPVGLEQLTTYKWIAHGDGHVRA